MSAKYTYTTTATGNHIIYDKRKCMKTSTKQTVLQSDKCLPSTRCVRRLSGVRLCVCLNCARHFVLIGEALYGDNSGNTYCGKFAKVPNTE